MAQAPAKIASVLKKLADLELEEQHLRDERDLTAIVCRSLALDNFIKESSWTKETTPDIMISIHVEARAVTMSNYREAYNKWWDCYKRKAQVSLELTLLQNGLNTGI